MKDGKWLEALTEKAKDDPYYQRCLEEVSALEPLFLNIHSSLPEL